MIFSWAGFSAGDGVLSECAIGGYEDAAVAIDGSALADKAGRSLVEIEEVSTQLAELLRSISESTRFQAKSSEDIANSMSGISEVTALVQKGSNRAAESVKTLVELSHELRQSVSPFKLPVDLHQSMNGSEHRFIN